jgi:hypothetical protein
MEQKNYSNSYRKQDTNLTKEITNLSRRGHILGIPSEPREKKAGNWEKRSDLLVPMPRVPETALGVSGHRGLLPPMDPWILGHCWATLCGTKGEPHRTLAEAQIKRMHSKNLNTWVRHRPWLSQM